MRFKVVERLYLKLNHEEIFTIEIGSNELNYF